MLFLRNSRGLLSPAVERRSTRRQFRISHAPTPSRKGNVNLNAFIAVSSLFILLMLLFPFTVSAQGQFIPRWYSAPWDSGGYDPTSAVWSMVKSELDLDHDGKKEFLITTAWSGDYYNSAYVYEATGDNNFEVVWSYSFYPYSSDYSVVTISDLNNNGREEILCLVDPYDTTYHGFYVFERDGNDNGFPALPTATWDFGLGHWFHEGTAMITDDFDNDGRDEVAVTFVESWDTYKSKIMIFSCSSDTISNTNWLVEFVDSTTMPVVGYALASTDLDKDIKKELIVSGWDTLRIAIYENTGAPDTYSLAADIKNISSYLDVSNDGIVEANLDNDSSNELYLLTGNGALLVATNTGDVSAMTASNFHWIGQYDYYNGMVGMTKADLDTNGIPELYLAGSYNEAVYRWNYNSGDVTDWNSYAYSTVFMDDTTDDRTSDSDQGYFRPTKIVAGDLDSDSIPDMLIASASFASDKPMLLFLEEAQGTTLTVAAGWNIVSLPLVPGNPEKASVFPTAVSSAFAFTATGYQQQDTLTTGAGYWLKFSQHQTVVFEGSELLLDTLAMMPGWNMIGSVSQSVPLLNVTANPPDLLISNLYGYNSGYTLSDAIEPGKGYWVKTNTSGEIILGSLPPAVTTIAVTEKKRHDRILERKSFIRGNQPR